VDLGSAKEGYENNKLVEVEDYKKFCELLENLHINIEKMTKLEDIGASISLIFTNFTATSKKVLSYKLNEPFNMLENSKVSIGGRIIPHLKPNGPADILRKISIFREQIDVFCATHKDIVADTSAPARVIVNLRY
jgi:hypothetical protein